ncbi:hypothetical protein PIB30_042861 [Stylosanthes scabra]|uniref:Uncharacterized protein n=1 Tax=Stylosanthes scabra TaxID=79078 RepID=A0ABU6YDQ6_9FABA|nr:hypothetical protein [Stylosanthes scabra]
MANSYLEYAHLWTEIFKVAQIDMSLRRQRLLLRPMSSPPRTLTICAYEAGDVGEDAIAEDVHMVDVQLQFEVGTPSQAPPEAEVPPQVQRDIMEFIQKASLRDEFRSFGDEDSVDDDLEQQDDVRMMSPLEISSLSSFSNF